eukprot:5071887-Amphidinium_carterae.1
MVAALAAYSKWGIPVWAAKEEVRPSCTHSLGKAVDGVRGLLSCPLDAVMMTWALVRLIIDGEPCAKHDIQVILG